MLVRVWEYEVVPGREAEFEQLYGSAGAWARLFARSAGHLGTELYRGVERPGRYLTVDRFSDGESWRRFRSEHGAEYAELDSRCAPLTTAQVEIGGAGAEGWHDPSMSPEPGPGSGTRHLSVHIDRPVAEVYAFASDPANLPRWAPGLGSSVVRENGHWFVETPEGRARVTFAPANDFGVLDHEVLTPSGETVYVPLRAVADGDGCEVIFSVRRAPGMTDADFDRDAGLVLRDLTLLKQALEPTER